MQNSDNLSTEPVNPEVHPGRIRFSIWDRPDAIEVAIQSNIVLGRSLDENDKDVTVDLTSYHGRLLGVSRRHALIFLTATGVAVRDLNSANGTALNGKALVDDNAQELNHGDELKVGGLYINIYFTN